MSDELEIGKMLTLSTAHITSKTADRLDKDPDDNNLGICVYPKSDYGWYISITETLANTDDLPKDLACVMKFALFMGCETLCLDCDGEVCNFLPTYEWDENVGTGSENTQSDRLLADDFKMYETNENGTFVRLTELNEMIGAGKLIFKRNWQL